MTVTLEHAISQQDSVTTPDPVLGDLRAGRPVVVIDPEAGRVVLALAGETATTEAMAFVVRFGSGLVTATVPVDRCRVLGLPPMLPVSAVTPGAPTDLAVSVDAIDGVGTGISARDRARTMRALADESLGHGDFTRPGHVLVVGVGEDPAHSYGPARELCELSRSAGLSGIMAFADLVSRRDETTMAGVDEAHDFAAEFELQLVWVQYLRAQ